MKSDNPNVKSIKHMAFAVRDAAAALASYARFLPVPADTELKVYPKSQNRVALFNLGGIEYQLCESLQPDGRFARWINQRGAEGLHHICYEVDDIDAALEILGRDGLLVGASSNSGDEARWRGVRGGRGGDEAAALTGGVHFLD